MKAEEIMTRDVATCRTEDSLDVACRLMWEHDCGTIPVLDRDQRVVGMVTDRDAAMAAWSQGQAVASIPVHAAMSHGVFACKPTDDVERVHAVMRERRVRRVPVVDDDHHLRGVLSLNDIVLSSERQRGSARTSAEREVAETLRVICEHRPQPRMGAAAA